MTYAGMELQERLALGDVEGGLPAILMNHKKSLGLAPDAIQDGILLHRSDLLGKPGPDDGATTAGSSELEDTLGGDDGDLQIAVLDDLRTQSAGDDERATQE